jgi:hypothetical protein
MENVFKSVHVIRDGARPHGQHAVETMGVDAWKRTVALVANLRQAREDAHAVRRHRAGYGMYVVGA